MGLGHVLQKMGEEEGNGGNGDGVGGKDLRCQDALGSEVDFEPKAPSFDASALMLGYQCEVIKGRCTTS